MRHAICTLITLLTVMPWSSAGHANPAFDFHYDQQRPGGDYSSFDARNVDECARKCEGESRCRAFDFNTYERRCWLKDRVPEPRQNRGIVSGVKYRGPADQQVPDRIAGLQIYDNTKRNGGDYANFIVGDVRECAGACAREERCQSFNYGKERRDCWLKASVPRGEPNNTVISGVKQGARPDSEKDRRPSMVEGVRLEYDIKRNGGDYTNFIVRNVEECARACAQDGKCRSFNFGIERRDCWLKSSVPQGVRNTTVISGVKQR